MDVGLADAIRALRSELLEAMVDAEGKPIRFRLGTVDLELQMAVTRSAEAGGGIRFWVVDATAKASSEWVTTHTLKLQLDATTAAGTEVWTGDELRTVPE